MSEEKIPSQISDAVTNQSPDYIYLKTGKINSFMFSVLVSVRFMKPFVSTSDSGMAPWYLCRETLGILLHFNLNLKLSPKIVTSLKSYFISKPAWKACGWEICLPLVTFVYLWLTLVTFPGLTEPYWCLLGLTRPYWALLGLARPCWDSLGLTGPYWVLLGLTGPKWALLCICLTD